MKGLYTAEEQMANLLRMKADSIERVGKWRLIDDASVAEILKDADKFKILIPIIEAKLKGTKSQGAKPQDKPTL
jgi:ribosome-binding protein aMBF1 (putative translation factor)